MKILVWLKKICTRTCVFYTVFITAVYMLGATIDPTWLPTPYMVGALLTFSAVLAMANSFLFSKCLVFPLRLLIHFGVTATLFYLLFVVWGGYQATGGTVIAVLAVYLLVYIICAVIVGVCRWLSAEHRSTKKEYKTVYTEKEEPYTELFGGKKQ